MAFAELKLEKELSGPILDLGGGGEGVIGRIYGEQVIAIDNRQEELDEAPVGPTKLLMDAASLTFDSSTFEHVTAFFSFMYMSHATQAKAIAEAARVLRSGGSLHIWDANITSAFPDPFLIKLDIDAAGFPVHTTYGVIDSDAKHDSSHFVKLTQAAELRLAEHQAWDSIFYLRFIK